MYRLPKIRTPAAGFLCLRRARPRARRCSASGVQGGRRPSGRIDNQRRAQVRPAPDSATRPFRILSSRSAPWPDRRPRQPDREPERVDRFLRRIERLWRLSRAARAACSSPEPVATHVRIAPRGLGRFGHRRPPGRASYGFRRFYGASVLQGFAVAVVRRVRGACA